MAEQKWTTNMVAERLKEAAETMKRLPSNGLKPRGYVSSWPTILRELWESYGDDKPKLRLGPPAPEAITRMDEAMIWLQWMEPDEVKVAWAVACGINRKMIGLGNGGVHRATVWREWKAVMRKLTALINMHNGMIQ